MGGNPVSRIVSATGPTAPVALDWRKDPFTATVQVYVGGGVTASYGLEYTLDDVQTMPPANVRWVPEVAGMLPAGTTASGTARYSTPVCAVRINVASLAGGNLEMRVLP